MTHVPSTTLLITSGNGPVECNQAVAGILKRMRQEAEIIGLDLDISATHAKHGMKSAVIVVHGSDHGAFAKSWCGTILWRAPSTLRAHHKRANWFIGVFILPQNTTAPVEINPSDVVYESFRAGGPGGQHQNTTDSAVRATCRTTGATAVAREMRSQHRNKALAFELHKALARGNPIRRFKGRNFREERVT